ncbi:MAG: hypothetical protein K9G39_00695 [Chlorobium sp.]|uniref:hypothetical protein n=1 Tax=Chlorobium sp. TaxID=1095 RepID=UPI0025BA7A25|nr:hypothetical protein [Chlorobium sp.]MCF8382103.1 hypothetical protein [Chlorobium sp.]
MTRKSKSLTGRKVRLKKEIDADGRDQREQSQNIQPADNFKAFETYERNVRRACIDAYVLLKDFPSRLRFSYFVGSDGKLLARCERRAGQ